MKARLPPNGLDGPLPLAGVLEARAVSVVFQPILALADGGIIGHEALVRGPAGSWLESPTALFAAAREAGRYEELAIICIQETLRAFSANGSRGLLFLNMSPRLVQRAGFDPARARRFLESLELCPASVVIELTEDFPAIDMQHLRDSLLLYRSMGFRVALDDLGEGFSTLRLWSELRPEFVKADKHFVSGIARDAVKRQFLRSIQHIALRCGSQVIAEGIEVVEDFRAVRRIGIALAQGWFIGRPGAGLA
ncbi:MAG: EAL domain-containing protein [Betaproteobacteria bacterium]|nr:EAL domain-containing protein [Betaproteobacteria bacterium]